MVAIMLGADNGFFYAGQVMHFSCPFTVFLIYHKHFRNFLTSAVWYHNGDACGYNTGGLYYTSKITLKTHSFDLIPGPNSETTIISTPLV